MDHLPTPKNAVTNERTIVPYVCLKGYDGGSFLTYSIREGVTHALPSDGNVPGGSPYRQHERVYPTPKQEQEDFLQRWLFFGLIHEILGDRYRPEDLVSNIETDDGQNPTVSTLGLVEALDNWISDIHAGFVNPRHTYEHIAECLRLAFATIHGAGPDFDPRIKFSLASLGELFTLATNEAYNVTANKCPSAFARLMDLEYAYWKTPMLSSGWCPSQVRVNVENHWYLQTMHFLTFLGQPASDGFHRRCSNDRCLAYQNELATYQTKHLTGCNCEYISIDTKRLTEILESGSLPLLRIQESHTLNGLSIELVPSQSTTRYIALSHVWADGLGNPYENALPRCQLGFLHETINKYYAKLYPQAVEEILLWCDTLCCPVEPGEAKNIALAQMKKTYLEATRVLVLDASLRMYDFNSMEADEACIRILNSGWTRRLWTLQEGALPAKSFRLSFLFKDEAININYLVHKMYQILGSSVGRKGLASNIITQILKFARIPNEVDGNRWDLGAVETGLQHRSVSVPSDEPLLIAQLLDLDVAYVLNGPCPLANCEKTGCDHSRTHRMWLLMPTAFRGIPKNVLLRVGPRLSEPGFRWAPSTLLYNGPRNHALYPRTITRNEDTPTTGGPVFGTQAVMFSTLLHLFAVLVSNLLNPLARSFYCIRARLETFWWIPAISRTLKRTNLVTENASWGVPTNRGLLVRFTGYSFSMTHCPPGIPPNDWNTIEQGSVYSRGVDGTWYHITRSLPAEHDPFLSTKSLNAIIQEESNLWITHVESAFNNPQLVAEAKNERQVTHGLLVQLLSDEEDIKYVRTKLHVRIGVERKTTRNLLEAAYQSARQVSQNSSAKGLGAKSDGEQNQVDDVNWPQHSLILEGLKQDIQRVAVLNASQDVTAAAEDYLPNGMMLFQALIGMMVVGGYGCLGPRTADEQQWCFD